MTAPAVTGIFLLAPFARSDFAEKRCISNACGEEELVGVSGHKPLAKG